MKKVVLLTGFFVIFFIGCGGGVGSEIATQEEMKHEYIQEFTDISKDNIFDRTMKWIANNFKSGKAVIDYQDKQAGSIVAKGIIPDVDYGTLINSKIGFTLNVDVKDNKIRLDFVNIMPMLNTYEEMPEIANRKKVHKIAKQNFDRYVQGIVTAITTKSDF